MEKDLIIISLEIHLTKATKRNAPLTFETVSESKISDDSIKLAWHICAYSPTRNPSKGKSTLLSGFQRQVSPSYAPITTSNWFLLLRQRQDFLLFKSVRLCAKVALRQPASIAKPVYLSGKMKECK
jgi:hypothetical protein